MGCSSSSQSPAAGNSNASPRACLDPALAATPPSASAASAPSSGSRASPVAACAAAAALASASAPSDSAAASAARDDASAAGASSAASAHVAAAARLLRELRTCEAAAELERALGSADGREEAEAGRDLHENIRMQLQALGEALRSLGGHAGFKSAFSKEECSSKLADVLLGVSVPSSPANAAVAEKPLDADSPAANSGSWFGNCGSKRDVLNINFELAKDGPCVEAVVEFFPDGSASLQWSAFELPIQMPYIICLVKEIDLLAEVAPFVVSSGVTHEFASNEADLLVQVVSKPPIPFVAGFQADAQRFGFDLLDTPWKAFCLVEQGPVWTPGASDTSGQTTKTWRGVEQPPLYRPGLRQVEVKSVVALGCPVGLRGERSTLLLSGRGDLHVPRSLLPNWLITFLVQQIGKIIYQKAVQLVAKFDSTAFGPRLQNSSFYAHLGKRCAQFAESGSPLSQMGTTAAPSDEAVEAPIAPVRKSTIMSI